jgi:magnesium chelatase subunit D
MSLCSTQKLTPPSFPPSFNPQDEEDKEPPPPPDLDDIPEEFMFDAEGVPMDSELLSFSMKQRQVREGGREGGRKGE